MAPDDSDSLDSGILNIVRESALLLAERGADLPAVGVALADLGLLVVPVDDVHAVDAMSYLPRIAIVELSVPGAPELLVRMAGPPNEVHVLAVVDDCRSEEAAMAAGAAATIRRPLSATIVLAFAARFRRYDELRATSRELFERDRESAVAKSVSRIGAALAHELRNPLAVAVMTATVLRQSESRDGAPLSFEERAEAHADLSAALGRVGAILSAVTGLARGEPPRLDPVSLLDVARAALASTAKPHGIALRFEAEPQVVGIGNRSLLEQVVVNLVKNAIDAVSEIPRPLVVVRVYQTVGEARISVRDNGPGVPANMREKIFEPFVSTKGASGSGLGLAISRQAVASMGGALTLAAADGRGACFRIRLRRSVASGSAPPHRASAERA